MQKKMQMSELMNRIPYTQIELGDMIGVTQTAISHFIHGRGFSLKIAHGLDVIANVEAGTAYAAAKAVQQERFAKAQRRLEKLGIDLSSQSPVGEESEPETATEA